MKIKTIKIENYRSIKKLSLDFDSKAKLIIGSNDKTRTDILDAIAIAISSFFSGFYDLNPKKITTKDGYKWLGEVVYPIRISSQLEIENKTFETVTELLDDTVPKTGIRKQKNKELVELTQDIRKRITLGESFPLPIIAYYPADREILVSETITNPELMKSSSRTTGYDLCLSKKRNLAVLNWLIACEYREYHTKEKIRILKYFREILNFFALPTDPFYHWSESTRNRKYLFTIVADLAFRSAYLNPEFCHYSDMKSFSATDNGIVLIDAIELHLDLEWQREFMPKLKVLFPNIQFITSTASPLVLSTIKPQDVIILESTQDQLITKSTESSYGMTCDRILEDLLNISARPKTIKEQLKNLFQMIENGNIHEAIAIKENLTKVIGSDPELTKAEVLIKRKQSLEE